MTALVRASPSGVRPLLDDLAMLIATNERGHVVKRPSKLAIGTMLANLRRGNAHMVLERVDEEQPGSWYIQVRLRENNTFQLEYRDGVAELHYQTLTISQEKVLGALLGWAGAKPGWRDGFMWNNIGEQFSPSDCGSPAPPGGTKLSTIQEPL
ncbi:hypothetical protein [Streptomyces sp. CBMA156]|uniref:hypothetical protein n=1 Tax=Streptomyces sp. CBMA156 TaxID=1930280 RepID=UPI001661EF08|nr:hypothetical protein [Streptomyces sp. CBMA156]MBD0675673.1 hypothetical protein [Streptomyces sp. CBMA156]